MNKRYNAEWSKDYYSLDPMKYERLIPGLTAVANSDLAKQPQRTDLRRLQEYLQMRKVVTKELNRRYQVRQAELQAKGNKGEAPKSLSAKENADLARGWAVFVDALVESDTRFGDLFHRYLARDMGVDALGLASTEAAS
jgi:hypothetical protein